MTVLRRNVEQGRLTPHHPFHCWSLLYHRFDRNDSFDRNEQKSRNCQKQQKELKTKEGGKASVSARSLILEMFTECYNPVSALQFCDQRRLKSSALLSAP